MADELELENEEITRNENRFKKLSEKVELTSKERDDLAKAKDTLEQEKASLSKERDFFKDFSTTTSKHPNAAEFQDKIWEKVKGGYSTEDAAVAVLVSEGKFIPPTQPTTPRENPAGGSAPTHLTATGEKPVSEMTQAERLSALQEAEKRGEISFT